MLTLRWDAAGAYASGGDWQVWLDKFAQPQVRLDWYVYQDEVWEFAPTTRLARAQGLAGRSHQLVGRADGG